MPSVSALEAEALPPIGAHLPAGSRRNVASLVMLGIFVTTFAQNAVFALYPIRHLFSHMGYDATAIAAFGRTSALAWYFKPVIGIFTDCFPLFRTRRKSYLLIGSLAGAVLWAAFAFIPQKYSYYLWLMVGVNLALVIGSAACGGLLVEEGQRSGATGGLSSFRYAVMNGASLIAGPVGGFLVIRTFHDTAYAGAAFCALLFFATLFLLHEPVAPGIDRSALANAGRQLKTVFTTPVLWLAAGFTFLVSFAPGFMTPLYFYQTHTLHFTDQFITDRLVVIGALGGIAGSFAYGLLCRRFNLLWMIIISITTYGFSALGYLHYHTAADAYIVEPVYNFFYSMAQVMTLDVAAQAAPLGCEAMSYGLLLSAYNIASQQADVVGSSIIDHFHYRYNGGLLGHPIAINIAHVTFPQLVWVNSLTTFLTLIAIPLLPRYLLSRRDGLIPDKSDFIAEPEVT